MKKKSRRSVKRRPVRTRRSAAVRLRARPQEPTASIDVRLFDGTRQPLSPDVDVIVRLFDGRQRQIHQDTHHPPRILFTGLGVADNLDDRWTVVVSADQFKQTGFTPVVLRAGITQRIDLMLVPNSYRFDFTGATWAALSDTHPALVAFLSHGASTALAQQRYEELMADAPRALAAFLNLWTAMTGIRLPVGSPVDYLKELEWEAPAPAPDRFFCYADAQLVEEVVQAADAGAFSPEMNPAIFHQGATRSYKEVQFGEANVQLTFHENDVRTIDGARCILVEPDIDYYKDLLAHGLLEVLPGTLTDPEQVYVLRWIAGRHAGVPEFDPPYTIVAN